MPISGGNSRYLQSTKKASKVSAKSVHFLFSMFPLVSQIFFFGVTRALGPQVGS